MSSPRAKRRRRRAYLVLEVLLLLGVALRLAEGLRATPRTITRPAPEIVALDRAPAQRLLLLPGIGPVRALALLRDRTAHGPPRTWADLLRVSGIGPGTVARLRACPSAVLVGSRR